VGPPIILLTPVASHGTGRLLISLAGSTLCLRRTNAKPDDLRRYYGTYGFQDYLKGTSKLTVLGLRWEVFGQMRDIHGNAN